MRQVSASEARQALLDLGWTADLCFDRMEGEGMPEFAAYETLFCLLSQDGAINRTMEGVGIVQDIAMLLRRFIYRSRNDERYAALVEQAYGFLRRHGLQGSPLRDESKEQLP